MSPLTAHPVPSAADAAVRRDLPVPAAPAARDQTLRRSLRAAAGVQAAWLRERPGVRRPA
jgi:hypothetical protein